MRLTVWRDNCAQELRFCGAFGDDDLEECGAGYAPAVLLVRRGVVTRFVIRIFRRLGWTLVYDCPSGLLSNGSAVGVEQDVGSIMADSGELP